MSSGGKCPMGKHPWLAMMLVIAFFLCVIAKWLGWLH
jgi:hypothetical protein